MTNINIIFLVWKAQNTNTPHKNIYSFITMITETTNMEMKKEMHPMPVLEYTCWVLLRYWVKSWLEALLSIFCGTKITLEWITPHSHFWIYPPPPTLPHYALPTHSCVNFSNHPLFSILKSPYPLICNWKEGRGVQTMLTFIKKHYKNLFSKR